MKKDNFEILIGFVVLACSIFFVLFFLKFSKGGKNITNSYKIYASFSNIEGISIGSDVKISGIKIGTVKDIYIDNKTYNSVVVMNLTSDIPLPIDSIFKVSTSGLIGGKYIRIDIGAEEEYLKDNDSVDFTESAMDLEDLVGRFIFNNNGGSNEKK